MFEGKAELFIRRWEPSFIPKLRKVAALEKGVVSSLLDQEGEQNDGKQSSFFQHFASTSCVHVYVWVGDMGANVCTTLVRGNLTCLEKFNE